ncbi:PTS mannose transporter subunit IID [Candidatus Riesia pediculischaeffi]|uniref:PTS system, mannose-specific IID component n=1 Tax=Candidatus Riesia pediculischaeffi PTSU TaxID=1401651 RepID=A0A0C1S0A5_9ENTR|nr:PTS mannose transporter subunit IID [Candidatus Riesia pediculischaeffi]KIE63987.1 PTS system, mannose-specific IID component [Candidatus Riesia pediculischaeffi PTSU]
MKNVGNEETRKDMKKISPIDLIRVFLRTNFFQGSWNFERMQALGFCFSMIPIIRKLYPENSKDRKSIIKRHLEFFNTHPYSASPILGMVIAMEEQRLIGKKDVVYESSINSMKVGLMGPLAGIGDPIFWGTVRPIFSALGAGIAMGGGSLLGPMLFFISFNFIRIITKYFGIFYGYKKGVRIIQDISDGLLQKVTEGSAVVGLFVMGALINKWTHINIPIVVSKVTNQKDGSIVVTTVQNILDQMMPGIVPLSLTFLCIWLLRKKINSLYLITSLFILSILGSWIGFLS